MNVCKLLLAIFALNASAVNASSAAGTETLVGIVGEDFVLLGADTSVSQSIALTASNLDKIAVVVDPSVSNEDPSRQHAIAVAAAGDAADADNLIGILSAQATLKEYEASVGCDVEFVPCGRIEREGSIITKTPAGLSAESLAHCARAIISAQLRTAFPLRVCLLVAGMVMVEQVGSTRRKISLLEKLSYDASARSFMSEQVQRQVSQSTRQFVEASSAPEEITAKSSSEPTALLQPRLFWLDEYGSLQRIQYGAHGYGSSFILSILDRGYRPNMTRSDAIALVRECFSQLRSRYVINAPQPPCLKCIDANGCSIIR